MEDGMAGKHKIGVICSSQSVVEIARGIAAEKNLDFIGAYIGLEDVLGQCHIACGLALNCHYAVGHG